MKTDAELLVSFLSGDGTAFSDLVRRHGAMVFGVCTRILGSRHDAEDAFQAVFVVLARRAGDVQPPDRLPQWLYGVARRTAMKVRSLRERRRSVEALASQVDRPREQEAGIPEDLWRVIDEEAARLPGRLLAPFVLCDMEGHTYREAARLLGLAEGTLSNRLAAARRRLAARLTRRGMTVPAAGLAVLFSPSSANALPANLLASTAETGGAADFFSPVVEGVIQDMAVPKTAKAIFALFLVLGLAWGGWSVIAASVEDKELKKLEGEWSVVEGEMGGKGIPAGELEQMRVTISGDRMTIRTGARQQAVRVSVDASTNPKSIDLSKSEKEVERGIYELDGTRLKICWGSETKPGGRTQKFATTQERGGRLLVLEKLKKT